MELIDGENVVRYGYNDRGDLASKEFPNGMQTAYQYDSKGQLSSLIHRDKEGI